MPRDTFPWSAAKAVHSRDEVAAYLDLVLEDGDPSLLQAALGDAARTVGMAEIAETTGLGRTHLYRALSSQGNPEFVTVVKVLRALGFRLRVVATETEQ